MSGTTNDHTTTENDLSKTTSNTTAETSINKEENEDNDDPCESVTCRTGAEPRVKDYECVCTCDNDHYYDDDDGCAECHNDDHCDESQACQSRGCVDPCLNYHCVSDAMCRIRNHKAECYCSDDTTYSSDTGCNSEGKSLTVEDKS